MKIAFVHYHLKTGGVTTVLRQQIESIQDICEVLVITGDLPDAPFPADIIHEPGLGYTEPYAGSSGPEAIAESICAAIFSKWPGGCDVVHVHNPTLAKNLSLLKILKALQKRNVNLFLQIHDFAEDGRPSVYYPDEYVSDCHYGVINSRDYNMLLAAGLKKEGLHKIFNTVESLNSNPGDEKRQNRILYPIRARRRKNVGEAIFLSIFFNNAETLSITLPPISPADLRSYSGWKSFVENHDLKVSFDEGLNQDLNTLVGSSKFFITTSITEGFGFSFLEPWTAGKLLWGRKLPDICSDFEKNKVNLDHLYTRFRIPVDWLGKDVVVQKWTACVLNTSALFNYTLDRETVLEYFNTATKDGTIDFGLLNEGFQEQVISHVISDETARKQIMTLNPFLFNPGEVADKTGRIARNKEAVERCYNRTRYRQTLLEIYGNVKTVPVCHHIDKKDLLRAFFDLSNFSLLKWCEDDR